MASKFIFIYTFVPVKKSLNRKQMKIQCEFLNLEESSTISKPYACDCIKLLYHLYYYENSIK